MRQYANATATTVYRAFDCYDDGARAPTPLPPIYLMKCVKEDEEQVMSAKPMATEASLSAQSTPSIRASGKSPSEATKGTVAPNRSSSSSTLSDCPSDLSDWEVSNKVGSNRLSLLTTCSSRADYRA